jgi:thioredoxin 1
MPSGNYLIDAGWQAVSKRLLHWLSFLAILLSVTSYAAVAAAPTATPTVLIAQGNQSPAQTNNGKPVTEAESPAPAPDIDSQAAGENAEKDANNPRRSRYKATVIEFSAVWCGPCRRMAPTLAKVRSQYSSKVKFVSYDVDDLKVGRRMQEKYDVTNIPTIFILDRKGRIQERIVGLTDENALTTAIEKVIAE